ncbi:MAG: efflux RND transporter permease subunit [Bacteroidales bacterium]
MSEVIIRYRGIIVTISVVLTVLAALMLPRLKISPSLDEYVPEHLENKTYLKELNKIFGSSEVILVMLHSNDVIDPETFDRLKGMAEDLAELEGIDRVISPFEAREISYEDGFMLMDPFLDTVPADQAGRAQLKEEIRGNKMASRFFADDFSLVSMILIKNADTPDTIIEEIQHTLDKHPGKEEVLLGGLPFITYSIKGNIKSDMSLLIPLALILMVAMLYSFFREWRGVILPFIIVAMSIIMSFGLMALLGWKISLITILMPIMLIAIANDYGIHLIAHYHELIRKRGYTSMIGISSRMYRDLKRPILITGLTTIGGILGLLTHSMVPAAQLGVLTAAGIAFALMLSLWFLPALLSYFKLPGEASVRRQEKAVRTSRWLNRFGRWVSHHPKWIVRLTAIVAVLGTLGILLVRVDTNIEGYFLGKSEVRRSTELINEHFGGSHFISVLFHGDVLQPEILHRMERYEAEIKKDPAVGSVNSPVTLLKELSKGFYAPYEDGYDQIPASADEAYQFLEVFSMGGNEEEIEQFIDYTFEYARILISLKDGSNRAGKNLVNHLKEMTRDDPNLMFITGDGLNKIELADMVVKGQILSLAFAMAVIFLLIYVIFKSFRAGLISTIPLSVAIVVLFGMMGIFGISLDIATALLSSIMIGVGIDYTIHFLWRFKVERAKGLNHMDAAQETLCTAGRGIFYNAFSVIVGFLALGISNFSPMRYFSALIVISISTCLISALLVVPSIVILVKPKFLEPKSK